MNRTTARFLGLGLLAAGAILGGAAALSGLSDSAQPALATAPKEQPDTPPRREIPALPAAKPISGEIRFGAKEAKPRTPGAIRLATYNVENLFDEVDDPTLTGDQDDLPMAKPAPQREAIAAAIRAVDADVIALEEIESIDALVWFRDLYLSDMGYEYVESIDAGDDRGIENGVLSRFPISNPRVWVGMDLGGVHPDTYGDRGQANWMAGQPLKFRRTPLCVDLTIPAGTNLGGVAADQPFEFTLFAIHHKSGGGSGYWREAEARKIVELVSEIGTAHPDRPLAIVGDFNSVPTDKVLAIYKAAGLIDTQEPRPAAAARGTPASIEAASYLTHASARTIDFVLVNKALASRIVPGSPFVLGTPILPEGVDYRSVAPPPGYASDHFPVVVDLSVHGQDNAGSGKDGAKVTVTE